MEEKEQFKYLYQLYLANLCTEEELKTFFELLDQQKDDQEIISLLSSTWDKQELIPEQGLNPEFLSFEDKKPQIIALEPGRKRRFIAWKAAAAIFLIITVGYLYKAAVNNLINPVHEQQLLSAAGERRQLLLPDGSKVWLGPGSKFNYPDRFDNGQRIVKLEGEAFFDVKHDKEHPFIIESGKVRTTVLGTSFNVKAYREKTDIIVTLVTGKVAVSVKGKDGMHQNTITSNQQIIVNTENEKITKSDFPDAASFLDKRLGLFNYNGQTLEAVINDVQIQYGITISLDRNLTGKSFYGHLTMTNTLEKTLDKLCLVMDAKWVKTGGIYVITN